MSSHDRDYVPEPMDVLTTSGRHILTPKDRDEASLVGSHWNAIRAVLEGRASARDRPFHAPKQVRIYIVMRTNVPFPEECPQDAAKNFIVRGFYLGDGQGVQPRTQVGQRGGPGRGPGRRSRSGRH